MNKVEVLEQAVRGVLQRAILDGSNVSVQGAGDEGVVVIIKSDDPELVQAYDEMSRGKPPYVPPIPMA